METWSKTCQIISSTIWGLFNTGEADHNYHTLAFIERLPLWFLPWLFVKLNWTASSCWSVDPCGWSLFLGFHIILSFSSFFFGALCHGAWPEHLLVCTTQRTQRFSHLFFFYSHRRQAILAWSSLRNWIYILLQSNQRCSLSFRDRCQGRKCFIFSTGPGCYQRVFPISLFMQLNHRSRFFLLPQVSGCWLPANLSLTLCLSCHWVLVPAATSGWKPSSGPVQCQLTGLFASYSFQLTLLCHFRNQSCFSATGSDRVFRACWLRQLCSAPIKSPGETPTHSEPHPRQETWGQLPSAPKWVMPLPILPLCPAISHPWPQPPSSLCSHFHLLSSLAFKQHQWNSASVKASGGFAGGISGKEPAANAGDVRGMGLIPGSGRSPGGGHGNPLQYSCLENLMDWGAWRASGHKVVESDTTKAIPHIQKLFNRQVLIITLPNSAVPTK